MKVYDKLVRDRIPEIIKDEGRTPVTRILERDDFIEYLLKKFPEELKEVQEAKGENEHFIEELPDLLELTLSLAEHTNLRIDLAQVEFSPDHELLQDDLLSLLVTQVNELIEMDQPWDDFVKGIEIFDISQDGQLLLTNFYNKEV